MKKTLVLSLLQLFLIGCNSLQNNKTDFVYLNSSGSKPFTFSISEDDNSHFSFAIISDLTGGEREGVFEKAIVNLNYLNPKFTISVGDLIEGGTRDIKIIEDQWFSFNKRLKKLNSPFFYVGGNHDLSCNEMKVFWEKNIGPTYYHFLYKDVLFLILNSEDYSEERMEKIFQARESALKISSGEIEGNFEETDYFKMSERSYGDISFEQIEYFKKVLNKYKNVRWTFLFMHKPLWKNEKNKKFSQLEDLMKNRNYSIFNGHDHSFSTKIINDQIYTTLSTTGGSQNSSNSNVFDQITLISMRDRPYTTHLKLNEILNY